MRMETEGLIINIHDLKRDHFLLSTSKKKFILFLFWMVKFKLMVKNILKGTFLTISQTDSFEIYCNRKSTIFEVISPLKPFL